jgi:ABC-type transport system involved in cytochrome bd biosynthesis fused ATPase/permease subunit
MLIVLILIGSFVGLGYLYSEFSVLQAENQELRNRLSGLQKTLDEQTAANEQARVQIDQLTRDVQDAHNQLAAAQSATMNVTNLYNACLLKEKVTSFSALPTSGMVLPPILATFVLAAFGFLMKVRSTRTRKTSSGPQKISLQLTREQLDEYIRFQRKQTSSLGRAE